MLGEIFDLCVESTSNINTYIFYRSVKRHGPTTAVILKTATHPRVELHPKSICSKMSSFESPFLAYHLMIKSSAIFLHDVTMVSPWALLFFGERLDIVEFENTHGIRVDDLIKLRCFKKTGMLIKVRLDAY